MQAASSHWLQDPPNGRPETLHSFRKVQLPVHGIYRYQESGDSNRDARSTEGHHGGEEEKARRSVHGFPGPTGERVLVPRHRRGSGWMETITK